MVFKTQVIYKNTDHNNTHAVHSLIIIQLHLALIRHISTERKATWNRDQKWPLLSLAAFQWPHWSASRMLSSQPNGLKAIPIRR